MAIDSTLAHVVLEPAVQELADATSNPPFVYQLDYADARKVLDDLQSGPVEKLPIDEEWITVPCSFGDARVRIIRPQGAGGLLPAIVYMHGGGWVLGNTGTHDRLVRELAVGANAALAFVPVTDAAMDTPSYDEFADGPWLTRKAMEWFWDAYIADPAQRSEITASPNQATVEQLKGLPATLLLVDEADVLRDEGEAYAAKLRLAGVAVTTVRYDGTCHDFMLLNALSATHATRAAVDQAIAALRQALHPQGALDA